MSPHVQQTVASQFCAALAMLRSCIEACPEERWDEPVAKYPIWQVVHHTLCFVDLYLSPTDDAWTPDQRPDGFHPKGWAELENEYPSRRFSRDELLRYTDRCSQLAADTILSETDDILSGPSGHKHRTFSRLELHIYNIRHIQHHTGAIAAILRKPRTPSPDSQSIDIKWVGRRPVPTHRP